MTVSERVELQRFTLICDECICVPDVHTNDVELSFQRAGSRTRASDLHGGELGPYAGFGVVNLGEVRAVTVL